AGDAAVERPPAGLASGMADAELTRARGAGDGRAVWWPRASSAHRELPAGAGLAGGAVRLYVDAVGVPARIFLLQRTAHGLRLHRRRHHRGGGAVRDLPRAPARAAARARRRGAADRILKFAAQNALKVMMVRVSWMPGIVCTFSFTK